MLFAHHLYVPTYRYIVIALYFCVIFQDPPIVELRFGKRMPDTESIGPGDDVYFECAARANPSTTIRYSWYHNVSNRSLCLFELYVSMSYIFCQYSTIKC